MQLGINVSALAGREPHRRQTPYYLVSTRKGSEIQAYALVAAARAAAACSG